MMTKRTSIAMACVISMPSFGSAFLMKPSPDVTDVPPKREKGLVVLTGKDSTATDEEATALDEHEVERMTIMLSVSRRLNGQNHENFDSFDKLMELCKTLGIRNERKIDQNEFMSWSTEEKEEHIDLAIHDILVTVSDTYDDGGRRAVKNLIKTKFGAIYKRGQ